MLLTALESVYAQTLQPDQVIVVLDGDTDSSAAAVRDAFPDTTLVIHETSLGPARSRLDGFKAVTAEWVCLLDDDDIWHSHKQEHVAEYLREHPSCSAVRSAFWQFSRTVLPRSSMGLGVRSRALPNVQSLSGQPDAPSP